MCSAAQDGTVLPLALKLTHSSLCVRGVGQARSQTKISTEALFADAAENK